MADPPKKPKVVKVPAVPPPVRIRKNASKMAANDPILLWYRRAIGAIKTGDAIDNFNSWRFQAAIHDYVEAEDPSPTKADAASPGRPFWQKCQHACWFFLPWHRIYLHHFEKILMAEIVKLGGPDDWALPYYNYSTSAADAKLPAAFRDAKVPAAFVDAKLDKSDTNHLFVAERHPDANAGNDFVRTSPNNSTNITTALAEPAFTKASGNFGFGGGKGLHHDDGTQKGLLERRPHDAMHGDLAGPGGGFMGGFTTAPLDPIFWLHHCNIDRVWEIWRAKGDKKDPKKTDFKDPDDAAWKDEKFTFKDGAGKDDVLTSAQVQDTRAKPLFYEYEDLTP
jgi:tyrosinase